jgi:hypothetical protein
MNQIFPPAALVALISIAEWFWFYLLNSAFEELAKAL